MQQATEPSWYAIRTQPGSQMPQREYAVERTGKRGKGYRIIPSLTPDVSAIERSLSILGVTYYMPAEKRLIRDRRKPDLWKTRRFALMVGYVFVRSPFKWRKLLETPGVKGIVANMAGDPLVVDFMDIIRVRAAEAKAEVDFDIQAQAARRALRKRAKRDPALQKLVDSLDIGGTITVPLDSEALAA